MNRALGSVRALSIVFVQSSNLRAVASATCVCLTFPLPLDITHFRRAERLALSYMSRMGVARSMF